MSPNEANRAAYLEESGSRAVPKYLEIADVLREELRHQPVGAALGSERSLTERFGVSRMTLRRALDELEREGRIRRIRGHGTFVGRPTVALGPTLTSFSEDMRSRGLEPSSRLLGFDRLPATPDVAKALGLATGEDVVLLERLRFADAQPICLEVAQFPARMQRLFEQADLEQSLHALLRKSGIAPSTLLRRVRAVSAPPREARLLGLADGSPALEVLDVFYDGSGRPIQWARSRYRADRYEVLGQLHRSTGGTGKGAASPQSRHQPLEAVMVGNARMSPDLNAPTDAYSRVIEANGAVRTAGSSLQRPETGDVSVGIERESAQVIGNVEEALPTLGLTPGHGVKTTLGLQHLEGDFEEVNRLDEQRSAALFPIRTKIASPLMDTLAEVDPVAVRLPATTEG